MKILLLTHSGDFFTIDRVQQALEDLGLHPIRINTDLYPQELKLNISIYQNQPKITLQTSDEFIDLDEVQGVWLRRIWTPQIDQSIDEAFRNICIRESQSVFMGIFPLLAHAVWVDPQDKIRAASNKLLQLKLAVNCGLIIPSTLITNDAQQATRFYHAEKDIITKMTAETSYSMGRSAMAMHTYKVEKEHVEEFDSLTYCPMVFQKEIIKKCELRVVYVAGDFFVGAIDASTSNEGKTDWRQSKTIEMKWFPFTLPQEIKHKLTQFMNLLGLSFGAIDLIVTPEDKYVFLEVNPVGEWGMLERDLDLPISKAIAETIYNKIKLKF